MATSPQIRAIQSLRRRVEGFDDAAYRAKLRADFRAVSSKELTDAQAGKLIEDLKRLAGQAASVGKRAPSRRADAPKLQALWISLYELGVVRSRDDAALIAFVARMTRKQHPRFLKPAETNRCVEALKQWAEREGVSWWDHEEPKACVCRAIVRKLVAERAFLQALPFREVWPSDVAAYGASKGLPGNLHDYTARDWDALTAHLGERLRSARAAKARSVRDAG